MLPVVPRRIVLLAFPGCQSLDLIGPIEVFHGARARLAERKARDAGYEPLIAGFDSEPVRSESGVLLTPDVTLDQLLAARAPALHTLIIPGGPGVRALAGQRTALAGLRLVAQRAERVASVCTGSFVLAACGLLDGRRATTHWAYCDDLARRFPRVRVEREPIYVRDDRVWTSAGVTAGIDLSLALVEHDCGPELANEVARYLVVFVRRSSAQPQLSAQLSAQAAERETLRELTSWLADHPQADLSVAALSRRCAMSPRNFARLFGQQLGVTPARYVERTRAEHARRLLETSKRSLEQIAEQSGFANAAALRRAMQRSLGVLPGAYRRRLQLAGSR